MGLFLREGGLPTNYFNTSGGWLDLLYGAMEEKAENSNALLILDTKSLSLLFVLIRCGNPPKNNIISRKSFC